MLSRFASSSAERAGFPRAWNFNSGWRCLLNNFSHWVPPCGALTSNSVWWFCRLVVPSPALEVALWAVVVRYDAGGERRDCRTTWFCDAAIDIQIRCRWMSNNRIRDFHWTIANAPSVNMTANCSVVRTFPMPIELSNFNRSKPIQVNTMGARTVPRTQAPVSFLSSFEWPPLYPQNMYKLASMSGMLHGTWSSISNHMQSSAWHCEWRAPTVVMLENLPFSNLRLATVLVTRIGRWETAVCFLHIQEDGTNVSDPCDAVPCDRCVLKQPKLAILNYWGFGWLMQLVNRANLLYCILWPILHRCCPQQVCSANSGHVQALQYNSIAYWCKLSCTSVVFDFSVSLNADGHSMSDSTLWSTERSVYVFSGGDPSK